MPLIEVDQSIKIEQTDKDTIVCASRGAESCVVIADRRLKRLLIRKYGAKIARKRLFFNLFALFAAFAVSRIYREGDTIFLDREYHKNEFLVEEMFYSSIRVIGTRLEKTDIRTMGIGKQSPAHLIAKHKEKATFTLLFGTKDLGRIEKLLGF